MGQMALGAHMLLAHSSVHYGNMLLGVGMMSVSAPLSTAGYSLVVPEYCLWHRYTRQLVHFHKKREHCMKMGHHIAVEHS